MGLFGKRKASADELATLHDEVTTLRARLEAAERAHDGALADSSADRAGVEGRLDDLGHRVECIGALGGRIDGIDRHVAAERAALHDGMGDVLARFDELAVRTATVSQLAGITGRLNQLTARLDGVADHRTRLDDLARRLDESPDLTPTMEAVEARLAELPEHRSWLEHLERRLDELPDQSAWFGVVHQRIDALPDHTGWLEHLQERLDGQPDHAATLVDHGTRLDELAGRVDALPDHGGRLDRLAARVDSLPDHDSRLDAVADRLGRLDRHMAELSLQACAQTKLAERLGALDTRMVAKAAQIDAQLAELAGDVAALADLPTAAQLDTSSIDALRVGQTKLATEQTRFQIALRDDLAGLAEQIRRLTAR